MRFGRSWHPFAALAIVLLVALLVSGQRTHRDRVYALGSPNQISVDVLPPAQTACEGPIIGVAQVGGARLWGAAVDGTARLRIMVDDARTGTLLSDGQVDAGTEPNAYTATLARTAPKRPALRVCVTNLGPRPFSLLGSAPVRPGVVMTTNGRTRPAEFSLVLVSPPTTSLLGQLGTAFSRASLFRPGWVGAWTFWLLTLGLLGTIVLAAMAINAAARADQDRMESDPHID